MKKNISVLISLLLIFSPLVKAEELPPLPRGPLVLTSVQPEQLSPDYWINRLPDPDKPLLSAEALKKFNKQIQTMVPDRVNIFEESESRSGAPIKKQLEFEFKTVSGRHLFGVDDQRIKKSYFTDTVEPRVNLNAIPKSITVRWGAAVRETSVRALPTETKMLEEVGDVEFDQLQYTLIKTWTPVLIFHEAAGGGWYYVQAPYARGWVKSKDIAIFNSKTHLQNFAQTSYFAMVMGESANAFWDAGLTQFGERLSMGTRVPYEAFEPNYISILLPRRGSNGRVVLKTAYLHPNADVSQGLLPYNQRNVIRQAFKLLGARYGWGGTYNGRDCSGFTHDVFLSLGVDMPRNSGDQIFAGTQLSHFKSHQDREKKEAFLKQALPGVTLLRMPLHMMLYLGEDNGQFYIIHATWAERIGYDAAKDEKRRINQVVVSDVSLNGNSYLGPLLDRITSITEVA